ncbi:MULTISPECIES: hypothetical protein [Providencia]|uniref:Uncharacterized protein n=1 Tax=Providencia stuartii TaxID=588 RepID=A0AAJ1N2Z4_PROST|nr:MULTISPECIES: hypothetical protein [Providencia]EMA3639491.1 hypothetical protein [Providencia stuartii]EMF0917755.1 hypothetical protein [Providencia stuartii]MBW3099806.1 hypothetical protein [Providencia stuartii]MCB5216245.1 hypothetical protein [Providencia stuartii]MCR4080792.1 hypothetical protein [Providencia stuartii]
MLHHSILSTPPSLPTDCPHCHSDKDIIPWGTGWMCRDCGHEWHIPSQEQTQAFQQA